MASGRSINHPDAKGLVRVLRERRLRLGLTRQELAGQIGVHRSAITRVETAKRAPHLGLVCRLAEALDLKIRFDMRVQ